MAAPASRGSRPAHSRRSPQRQSCLSGRRAARVRGRLLGWFGEHGRSFVWRRTCDPYTLLVSELLLKKTTAEQVERSLPGFLKQYPSIEALARADTGSLVATLTPLGLSKQRAGQLLKLAEALVSRHGGKLPDDLRALLRLPGVGEYTANAIRAAAYRHAVAAVDTNVARVITRMCGITPSRFEARRSPEVWHVATRLVGRTRARAYQVNWALLDLGALICRPRNPRHDACPVRPSCAYAAEHSRG
jgi:A/G-specific adenine glycosylase